MSLRLDPKQPGAEELSKISKALGQYIQAILIDRIYLLPHVLDKKKVINILAKAGTSDNMPVDSNPLIEESGRDGF